MRYTLTLLFLTVACLSDAQKLTGIWRGYFSSAVGIYRENTRVETYKYEIQIDQQANNAVKGVTYSYKTTVFYGKAELTGIFNAMSKSLTIRETKLVDIKIGDKSEPCLMTCYLDYSKIGKLEILEGTFISTNVKDKGDCGSGKVYLERVTTSDFKKEDFLNKSDSGSKVKTEDRKSGLLSQLPKPAPTQKDNAQSRLNQTPLTKTVKPPVKAPLTQSATANPKPVPQKTVTPPKTTNTSRTKPAVKDEKKPGQPAITPPAAEPETPAHTSKKHEATISQPTEERKMPVPKVLLERENNLVKTITLSEEDILVELYDNGTIDNDTVTVYLNNEKVINSQQLALKPLSIRIKGGPSNNHFEIVVVADNLGEIPPNTAMMIIKAGRERHEIFLASNEQRNAKVVINWVPKKQ
jgi:hypothetical protein